MNTYPTPAALRRTAKITGLLYLVFALLGIFSFAYVQPRIFGSIDAANTAQNMLAQEDLFRLDLALGTLTLIMFILLVLLFDKMLRHVDPFQSRLMVALVLVALPVAFTANSMELTALSIFKGNLLKTFPLDQAQNIAMAFIKASKISCQLLTLFWGLWLVPLGILVYKSRFIPRIFGVLLLINGLGYLVHCSTFILFPTQLQAVSKWVFPTYFAGEIPLIFWLLIKGGRGKKVT